MKRNKVLLIVFALAVLVIGFFTYTKSSYAKDDLKKDQVKAVWISTVYNLDYPKTKGEENQKNEFIKILDDLKKVGVNKVIVQVRPKGDALYKSKINPWSDVLTGVQGKDPGYDPLEFMIKETHKRGMTIHAWLNPYRVTTSGGDHMVLHESHFAYNNPELTLKYNFGEGNEALNYNPASPEVKNHIVDTVKEIIDNYDVDGIHFDDYFYPGNYPLPEGESRDGDVGNERREHVNDMIEKVGKTVRNSGKNIKFGVSPGGIWKNKSSDSKGSNTSGSESYYSVYADTKYWIDNNLIDYIAPQIYWEIGHKKADYKELAEWWNEAVNKSNVELYIGQGIYKEEIANEIDRQIKLNNNLKNIRGSYFFSLRDIQTNSKNVRDKIVDGFTFDKKEDKGPFKNLFRRLGDSSEYTR